jgi:hypothetical protein
VSSYKYNVSYPKKRAQVNAENDLPAKPQRERGMIASTDAIQQEIPHLFWRIQ